jgi:hypothetical protein
MIEDMQIRNLTPNTQRVYVAQVIRFAYHFRKSPDLLGPPEIRSYLLHLTRERRLAASSIIVTVSALRFFYAVTLKRPWVVEDDIPTGRQAKKLPVVLSQDEVARFLGAVGNLKHRVILTVCYATGLRISEAVRLKPAAIDSKRMVIRVEQGKGHVVAVDHVGVRCTQPYGVVDVQTLFAGHGCEIASGPWSGRSRVNMRCLADPIHGLGGFCARACCRPAAATERASSIGTGFDRPLCSEGELVSVSHAPWPAAG